MLFQECESLHGWLEVEVPSSDPEAAPYLVLLPPWDRVAEECSCSCQSYEFRGHCRHQVEALNSVCSWEEKTSDTKQTFEQTAMQVCPDCGGPTRVVT